MQNNQNFLEKMQGLLHLQSMPPSTEQSEQSYIKHEDLEGIAEQYRPSYCNNEDMLDQFAEQNVHIDPTIHAMFTQSQDKLDESCQNEQQSTNEEQMQMDPNNMLNPEYMQLFSQFYQVFIELQQQLQNQQIDPTNEHYMGALTQFFLQMIQQNVQGSQDVYQQFSEQRSPLMNYNRLPLASIPESKESIYEENSQWQNTVQSKQLLMSSGQGKDICQTCNHCAHCLDQQKLTFQPCSNFNPSGYNSNNSQKKEGNQMLNNPFGSYTPSQNTPIVNKTTTLYNQGAMMVNQNLSQAFQQQYIPSKDQQYLSNQKFPQDQLQSPRMNQLHVQSPNGGNNQVLSPLQLKQNKVIEYMIDSNDFSNYKHRRNVIKGERLSRTLSGSGQKSTSYNRTSLPMTTNTHQHQNSVYQQILYEEHPPLISSPENATTTNVHHNNRDIYQFFSPQLQHNKNAGNFQLYTYKNSFEVEQDDQDIYPQHIATSPPTNYDSNNMMFKTGAFSPLSPADNTKGNRNRKRTQEKIKQIRIINEKTRQHQQVLAGAGNNDKNQKLKKGQYKKNVFEVKDLKKIKKGPTHARKQSYNAPQNTEKQQLIQSTYQDKQEMSQENIQDLILNESEEDKENICTFKSLNSVWRRDSNQQSSAQLSSSCNTGSGAAEFVMDNECQLRIDLKRLSENFEKNPHHLGQEIHIIKKPVQTEEFKKIQERLNKYYKDKQKDEEDGYRIKNQQKYYNNNNNHNDTVLSMTKTLSSFKSLMMKTMSQMSVQQDNNIPQQYAQGKRQRMISSSNQHQQNNNNESMNCSSIQDDYSAIGGDFSENLTKIISPKNLYNGSLKNVKQRNPQQNHEQQQYSHKLVSPQHQRTTSNLQLQQQQYNHQKNKQSASSCLPNVLFFKNIQQNQQQPQQEDTLSLKYNSRQPSLCCCGQSVCICDSQKKDLLGHFQNFLSEMDKQPSNSNNNQLRQHPGSQTSRESYLPSPITFTGNNTTELLMSNIQGFGRSSSQNSLKRQSAIPKMKRFSSGSNLTNLPFQKNSQLVGHHMPHSQSITNIFSGAQIVEQDLDHVLLQNNQINHNNTKTAQQENEAKPDQTLDKLDTNKEEEIRVLNIENDLMQKAFLQKSHKLNLEQSQRMELLQRIQRHKQSQMQQQKNNNSDEVISNGVATTQNSSHTTYTNSSQHNSMEGMRHRESIIAGVNTKGVKSSSASTYQLHL